MYSRLFGAVKKLVPKISQTELVALRSGNTSIDREILSGKVNLPKKSNWKNIKTSCK